MEYLNKLTKTMVSRLRKKYTNVSYHSLEDAVQEALLRYLEKNGNLDKVTEGWVWVAANRILIDQWRHDAKSSVGCVPEIFYESDGECLVNIAVDSQREAIKTAAESLAYPDQK